MAAEEMHPVYSRLKARTIVCQGIVSAGDVQTRQRTPPFPGCVFL